MDYLLNFKSEIIQGISCILFFFFFNQYGLAHGIHERERERGTIYWSYKIISPIRDAFKTVFYIFICKLYELI